MEKFIVNKDACIGCGACQAVASDTFEITEDGLAASIEGKNVVNELTEEELANAMDALEGCPTSAIQKIAE